MQRAVDGIDPSYTINEGLTSSAQVFKDGHGGLLSTNFEAKAPSVTEVRENYKPPRGPGVRTQGKDSHICHTPNK